MFCGVCCCQCAGDSGHNFGAKKRNHDSKHVLIKFIRRNRFLGPELVTFLGPKFGFACSFMIPPWLFQQNDSILHYANKLDTMGDAGSGGETDFYMVPTPCLWPHRQGINSPMAERRGLVVPAHVLCDIYVNYMTPTWKNSSQNQT